MRVPVIALSWASPALALALSAGVQAHEPEKSTSPEAKNPTQGTVTMTTAESMIVVRDKQTGKLRRATPEEMEKLLTSGRAQASRLAAEPYEVRAKPGQRAMALGEAGMSNQVARRNAQGGIDEVCVSGDEEAVAKAMSTPVAKAKAHE